MISVSNLSVKIGEKYILQDISCDLAAGESLVIVGANGAGKSTFLKSIVRLIEITSGSVLVDSRPIKDYSRTSLAKIVAYLPQQVPLHLPLEVYDFILMGRYAHQGHISAYDEMDHTICRTVLEKTGCSDLSRRRLDRLSAGEKQRVLIANCLAQEPKILLLDEPTTFLDPKDKSAIEKLLVTLARDLKLTLVWVTHDINIVPLLNEKVLALKSGAKIYYGSTAEFLNGGNLSAVFDQDYKIISHPESGRPYIII